MLLPWVAYVQAGVAKKLGNNEVPSRKKALTFVYLRHNFSESRIRIINRRAAEDALRIRALPDNSRPLVRFLGFGRCLLSFSHTLTGCRSMSLIVEEKLSDTPFIKTVGVLRVRALALLPQLQRSIGMQINRG